MLLNHTDYIQTVLDDNIFHKLLKNKSNIIDLEELCSINYIITTLTSQITIQKHLSKNNIKLYLYFTKFIFDNWLQANQESRICKKLSLRIMFLSLIVPEASRSWKKILKATADTVRKSWHIHYRDYPYLTEKEKDV